MQNQPDGVSAGHPVFKNDEMIRYLLSRIGCLMMIFGVIVLVVGVAALQSEQPALTLLFVGSVVTFFGHLLWNQLRDKAPRNKRFSVFRNRKREEEGRKDNSWEDRFYD
jgi:uncharacterized membrane protein YfcA